jgi:toxin ParE1/3/4
MKLVWSPLAMERVREHAQHIQQDNPPAARSWISQVFATVEQLRTFPHSGRVVPEIGQANTRELLHRGYRIIYRVEPSRISVLTVRHSRQNLSEGDLG